MGRDKSFLLIDGQPFLSHICDVIRPHFRITVVVAADQQELPPLPPEVRTARDAVPDGGPLPGLLTGLDAMCDVQPALERIWLGSCDTPLVNLQVIDRLLDVANSEDAVVVRQSGKIHPFGGVYRTGIRPTVDRLIAAGERRLQQLPLALDTRVMESEGLRDVDPQLEFLANINTPEDYQRHIVDR